MVEVVVEESTIVFLFHSRFNNVNDEIVRLKDACQN
jgi:hypothetical protein